MGFELVNFNLFKLITLLHDSVGLGIKCGPNKVTNRTKNILTAEYVMLYFRELRNE